MEAVKVEQHVNKEEKRSHQKKKASFYQTVWRWHFYAGIIFAPFLLILAFSGGVYLFKPQIETMLYQDMYYVEAQSTAMAPTELVNNVTEANPRGTVTSIRFYDDPTRTVEIGLMENEQLSSVFVNPYSGSIVGSLNNEEKFTEIFKKLHSELIVGGTVANRLVELAACWAVILLLTGLYIWWPRKKASIFGTVIPRFKSKGRTFWRDLHAVPAFWLSIFIVILIATGLPWSGVMGEQINRVATSTNTGYPPFTFGEKPDSLTLTKDVAEDIPWAAENVSVPESALSGYVPLALEEMTALANEESIEKPYTISMPQGETGVYTVSTSHTKPGDNATLHVDQYSGEILADVRFSDYGVMAKGITLGIALHEGRLFGLMNQIIGLIVCIGLIGVVISSFIMWRKRKPTGHSGAPRSSIDKRTTRTVFAIMIVLGVIMPLVGLSIIIVYLLDKFIFPLVTPLKAWIH
ncbi:PepSY domain-containing protein [Anaerobacillus sp. 1_MG-2023]|uniref:PepSY-associated TM helix domain-containing protein n=1 Tax=Bacillales TaxID=1385 RepID=UPI0026E21EB0|nr:PepSY domain-containing protein [Anaerobacillus sp. 1_MG-2023]MDO6654322.1 PepSY domain-containing protein [Anaerobacillus sp. 1_MG-2023]